jgi:hypothetical protein
MTYSKKSIGGGLIVVGGILLIITMLGHWSELGRYQDAPPRSWESFDPELVSNTPDLDSLFRVASERAGQSLNALPPGEAMKVLYETVIARFTHGNRSHYNLFSNWILWSLGKIHPALPVINDPDALLKYGHSGLCSQTSFVLLRLAQKAGIRPRHVGLFGHVVMEAWYDGDWHLYDPDLEIPSHFDGKPVVSVATLSADENLVLQAYAGRGDEKYVKEISKIIASRENNTFMSYPVGSQFEWKTQVLALFERATQILKFIIPVLLILSGTLFLTISNRSRS